MRAPTDDATAFGVFNEIAIIEHLSRTAAERVMPEAGRSVLRPVGGRRALRPYVVQLRRMSRVPVL